MTKRKTLWLGLLVTFSIIAAACGDSSGTESGSDTTAAPAATTAAPAATTAAPAALPGEGVDVVMGRADWASGYIQAEIYNQIVSELGYNVQDPSEIELGPSNAYIAMASGDFDFWTNSWYPGHLSWHQNELPDGTLVGDHLTIVGGLFEDAGVQGMLVTKTVAEEHGITSMQQINDDPALTALFDTDGDGVGEFYGCQESWTCDDILETMVEFYNWDNLVQTKAGYDAMFAEMSAKVENGEPAIIYTWTPSAYVTSLIPGDNVIWLTMHPDNVLDDSNPLGVDGGEFHSQDAGFSNLGADSCTQPCQLGWNPADIQVTANTAFLEANPVLAALFPLVTPSVIDVSILQVEQDNGNGSQAHVAELAAGWIAANRDLVDGWISTALAAG